ncbi:DNA cytosine methyltransferase [Vibrio vulnificus]|uniref:DNA cytosine methyltransferase n=1 Tax=Vibrio vulnificus TaxID=672 RepID=UPI004058044B
MPVIKILKKKVGIHRKSARVWFDGAYLLKSGFAGGVRFSITALNNGALQLSIDRFGAHVVSDAKRGGNPRPIIELLGKTLGELAKTEHVKAVIKPDTIIISRMHTEEELRRRNEKLEDVTKGRSPLVLEYDAHRDTIRTNLCNIEPSELISLNRFSAKCDILRLKNCSSPDEKPYLAAAMIKTLQPFMIDLQNEHEDEDKSKLAVLSGLKNSIQSMGYTAYGGNVFLSKGLNASVFSSIDIESLCGEQLSVYQDILKSIQQEIPSRVERRISRLALLFASGSAVDTIGLFHGAGIMCESVSVGMQESSSIKHRLVAAVELDEKYLDISLRNNLLWDHSGDETQYAINMAIQDVDLSKGGLQACGVLAGIPCVGASVSGLAKNKLASAENHSSAGGLFIDFLHWINVANPIFSVIENVVPYKNTVSMKVIRSTLKNVFGYDLSERDFNGLEFGALENRTRFVCVAICASVSNIFSLNSVCSSVQKPDSIGTVLNFYPEDSERWEAFDYLRKKEIRDIEAGKGFRLQWLGRDAPHVGVIGTSYAKRRGTEPYEIHPTNPDLARLFDMDEHARLKTIPERFLTGVASKTLGHAILGQSVIYNVFCSIGKMLGESLDAIRRLVCRNSLVA